MSGKKWGFSDFVLYPLLHREFPRAEFIEKVGFYPYLRIYTALALWRVILFLRTLLEYWNFNRGPSKLEPRFLANSFLALNYVFSVQVWYICLNKIDLSKKSTFCLFKTKFKAKKLFARNRGIQLRRASVKVSIL